MRRYLDEYTSSVGTCRNHQVFSSFHHSPQRTDRAGSEPARGYAIGHHSVHCLEAATTAGHRSLKAELREVFFLSFFLRRPSCPRQKLTRSGFGWLDEGGERMGNWKGAIENSFDKYNRLRKHCGIDYADVEFCFLRRTATVFSLALTSRWSLVTSWIESYLPCLLSLLSFLDTMDGLGPVWDDPRSVDLARKDAISSSKASSAWRKSRSWTSLISDFKDVWTVVAMCWNRMGWKRKAR